MTTITKSTRVNGRAAKKRDAAALGASAPDTLIKAAKPSAAPKRTTKGTAVAASKGTQDKDAIRLSFLIHDVSRMRRSAYDQFMKPLSITRAKWWVLAHLSRQDGMMQTQLASVLEVGKASLGILLEKLESDGWVTRHEDLLDKRAKRVFLTRPAHNLIARMTKLEHAFNNEVLADLTEEERTVVVSALQKMKDSLSKIDFRSLGKP